MNRHGLDRQANGGGNDGRAARRHLQRPPDLTTTIVDVGGAVLWLERRMREQRLLEGQVHPGRGGAPGAVDVAGGTDRFEVSIRFQRAELLQQVRAALPCSRALVPGDRERFPPLLRRPGRIGDDSDAGPEVSRILETGEGHDLFHTRDGEGARRIDTRRPAAVDRAPFDGAVQHPRHADIDAVQGRAANDRPHVDAAHLRADQPVLRRVLERWRGFRHGQPRGVSGERSIIGSPPRGAMHHEPGLGFALGCSDAPAPRR